MNELLALELASTIRATKNGLIDTIATPEALTAWSREHTGLAVTADTALTERAVALRQAVRSLFARAVRPGEPSSADPDRLPPPEVALALINEVAASVPTTPRLDWPPDGQPRAEQVTQTSDPGQELLATLARAAIAFLAGPRREHLRTCPAPRCVLYFVKEHTRQEWCSTACGNRARAARHYTRHRTGQ
ncbi:CGNR zinc finger domain-containing protein [Spirillospora sp. CA-294931]|uniref:CGNR zinc finger domain-containing protein n=1 Tax=Spirillospora sp. CA-294931 TaxID=3240042 RepID=UPI003D8AEA54